MSHKKHHLPRGVELEKRRYIGFQRLPVIDNKAVYPSGVGPAASGDPLQAYRDGAKFPSGRPWIEGGK